MANAPDRNDVSWTQGSSAPVYTIDLSQPASSAPVYLGAFRGYSYNLQWTGTPSGLMQLQVANAARDNHGQIVAGANPIIWQPVDPATLTLGAKQNASDTTAYATTPSTQGEDIRTHLWARLVWTPSSGSSTGALYAQFGAADEVSR